MPLPDAIHQVTPLVCANNGRVDDIFPVTVSSLCTGKKTVNSGHKVGTVGTVSSDTVAKHARFRHETGQAFRGRITKANLGPCHCGAEGDRKGQ